MSWRDDAEVYAVPGAHSIIDTINPDTGRTRYCGHTEADVLAREPGAVRMTWQAWKDAMIARQRTPITWALTTRETYEYMLNVLPPIDWWGGAFLVGEPMDHDVLTGQPRYEAFAERGLSDPRSYYASSRPLTRAELRAELGR
jgi:hypothetical protein